jgi:perosamine synthetase
LKRAVKTLGDLGEKLKAPNEFSSSWVMSIPIRSTDALTAVGHLLPINWSFLENVSFLEKMTTWRSENQHAYIGRFQPTADKTRSWLNTMVLQNRSRLLFLVADREGCLIGHMGLAVNSENGTIEIDNVVRGEHQSPGLMKYALRALEEFAESEITLEKLALRVLASNNKAVRFYEKSGYEEVARSSVEITYSDDFLGVIGDSKDEFILMEKPLMTSQIPEKILTAGPLVGSLESFYAFDAARNGWNNRHSEYISRFETEFAELVGAKYAMATSSCTGALHLSLLAAGIGPGDEVIVPEITWVATASAVAYTGATPVFCDVDLETWTLDVSALESLISPRTKAVMPVHLYGFPAEIEKICVIAKKYGIKVIEDAAPAIGATKGEKTVGTFGDIGCFSFQGAKLLVTGEGGMLTTDNEELYLRAKKLQDHGRRPGTFWIEQLGYKYKMSNVTAALGLAQIQRAENQILRKRRIRTWYEEFLGDLPNVVFQMQTSDSSPIHWMTSIRIKADNLVSTSELRTELDKAGVDTRPVFPAISRYEFWKGEKKEPGPNAMKIASGGINLPSGVGLSRSTVEYVSDQIIRIMKS